MAGLPVRKQDPNRFKHIDLLPEDAKKDVDFMRMVQDLEDQQSNRAGWLFARGAFDKTDLLYLRDEEERLRHTELDLLENERTQFLAMKAKADEEEDRRAAAARAAAAAAARKAQQEKQDRKRLLVPMVRLKPSAGSGTEAATGSGSGAAAGAQATLDGNSGGPAAKRARPGVEAAAAPAADAGAGEHGGGGEGQEGPGGAAELASAGGQPPAQQQQQQAEDEGSDGGGLAGLLGGYGSDSDGGSASDGGTEAARSRDAGDGQEAGQQQQQAQHDAAGSDGMPSRLLPSAADLLGE